VPVHSGAAGIEQHRAVGVVADGLVEAAADCRRQWNKDCHAAFANDSADAVAVFLEVGDVQAGGFEVAATCRSPGACRRADHVRLLGLSDVLLGLRVETVAMLGRRHSPATLDLAVGRHRRGAAPVEESSCRPPAADGPLQ
jgi:hypothetical protein